MELSAIIVVIVATLLFIGFPVWGAIYSRRSAARGEGAGQEKVGEAKSDDGARVRT